MAQDTLSDVLRGVRLRGAVFFNVSGSSDWAAEAPPAREIAPLLMRGVEHVIEYHAVAAGQLLGRRSRAVRRCSWSPATSSCFRTATRTSCRARPACAASSDIDLVRRVPTPTSCRCAWPTDGDERRRVAPPPDGDAETTIVCGFLGCDLQPFNPLIAALPRLLHLRAGERRRLDRAASRQQAVAESQARRARAARRCWRG